MDSTTLVTFRLRTPRMVQSVQLLGSWDNFSKPYPMEKDKRLGRGYWRGCHSFTNIICDGDTVHSLERKRDGALLEGGRYWYYYRVDDDVEIHDETEPSTTNCPFLPGQQVNVLEVPVQVEGSQDTDPEPLTSCASADVWTLNPEDKFRTPVPLVPESQRRLSVSRERPMTRDGSRLQSPSPVTQLALDDERVPSSGAESICSEPPIPVTGWNPEVRVQRPHSTGSLPWGDCLPIRYMKESDPSKEGVPYENTSLSGQDSPLLDAVPKMRAERASKPPETEMIAEEPEPEDSFMDRPAPITSVPRRSSIRTQQKGAKVQDAVMFESDFSNAGDGKITRTNSYACSLQHTASISSARTSGMWSSVTSGSGANDGNGLVKRLSQPLTPTMGATSEVLLDPTIADSPLELNASPIPPRNSGFLGYSLPEAECSSVLTIRNLETATSRSSGPGAGTYNGSHRKQYVEAWNDGSEHRTTALQELVDDLGYLGALIA